MSNQSRPFGPEEISSLYAVYEAALGDIAEGDTLTDLIPARDLRRNLAAGIIAAAQRGVSDRTQLKEAGLAALRSPPWYDRFLRKQSRRLDRAAELVSIGRG